ncbi:MULTISPECIES: hypothetical protein [unclassified Microbacterium]|uniref:hypothetical protein n=1 Tax=unclassified Microbacterium TaxID=2609290 RepID=UPI000EA9CBBC|nr:MULTISPECIES: hypothetical protein [unclassified Microbacterium]MBT2484852.1 hypothetical protein [Microbacterium sp. ISL-108]RKN67722.1 hypothetical protein D7252_09045 [Microbacterium sp. CGR2]
MSAVDVKVGDVWHHNLSDWSVVADSTPLIPGDTTGGAGAMSFTLPETPSTRVLKGKPVTLRDAEMGTTTGELGLGSGNGVNASVTGLSKIAKLNVTRTAEAYSGTLRGAILYYLGLCGITTNIVVSAAASARPVNYIGWEGNVLDHLKDLCIAQQIALSLIGDKYAFRTLTGCSVISARSFADYSWSASEGQLAQNVEVAWSKTFAPANQLIYPVGGWNEDVQVFQVDANEIVEYNIDLTPDEDTSGAYGISATSILQPSVVDSVLREYVGSASVYAVSGKDNLPIKAAQWKAGGGDMKLELLDGGSRIKVTITGPSDEQYAPYQISMTASEGDYSSLRIYGTGMLYQRSVLRMSTGLSADRAPQEVAPIVEMPFLNSYEQAWRAAQALLSRHSSATYSITGTIGTIETLFTTPEAFFGGEVVAQQDPATHPLGNLEGSFFVADGLLFRIRSVTYAPDGATFKAEQHCGGPWWSSMFDFATRTTIRTAAQWNDFHPAGITAGELSANPMNGASA